MSYFRRGHNTDEGLALVDSVEKLSLAVVAKS
jgi:hypothetical protein